MPPTTSLRRRTKSFGTNFSDILSKIRISQMMRSSTTVESSGGLDTMRSMKTLLTLSIALLTETAKTRKSSRQTTGSVTTNHLARSRITSSTSSKRPSSTRTGNLPFLRLEKWLSTMCTMKLSRSCTNGLRSLPTFTNSTLTGVPPCLGLKPMPSSTSTGKKPK